MIECHTERSRSAEKGKRVQSYEFRVMIECHSERSRSAEKRKRVLSVEL